MATVGELAQRFEVTQQTVRGWAKEFERFLSEEAKPDKGQTRHFNEADVEVLSLVARMRDNKAGYESIHEALERGDRTAPPPLKNDDSFLPPAPVLAVQLARREAELESTRGERDRLLGELADEREGRRQAEHRAAVAETRLEMLQRLPAPAPPTDGTSALTHQERPPAPVQPATKGQEADSNIVPFPTDEVAREQPRRPGLGGLIDRLRGR